MLEGDGRSEPCKSRQALYEEISGEQMQRPQLKVSLGGIQSLLIGKLVDKGEEGGHGERDLPWTSLVIKKKCDFLCYFQLNILE